MVVMKTQIEICCKQETVSAFMDGQLPEAELSQALEQMGTSEARECWQLYHLVGDVLRSGELAACGHDEVFVQRLHERLALEPRAVRGVTDVVAPIAVRDAGRVAANDGMFRWKMVAGLASFAAVAAIGWGVMGGAGPQPTGSAPQLAQADVSASGAASVGLMQVLRSPADAASNATPGAVPVMLRDPRLDELLAAHRAATGASALGNASGFLRNATFEGSGR